MNNWFNNWLTHDEQKVLGWFCLLLVAGMLLHYAGFSVIYAVKQDKQQTQLQQAVQQDTVFQIDLRTASQADLELLPGIGPKKAQAIIAYRTQQQFRSPQELMNVKGIGAKTFLKLQSMLLPFGTAGEGVKDKAKLAALSRPEMTTNEKPERPDTLASGSTASKHDNTGFVHLNTATLEELQTLTGIGPKKAQAILDYRKQIGKFTSIDQLTEVKGIGPKTLEKNRNRLKL